MSKKTPEVDATPDKETPAVLWRVKITVMGTRACGAVFAKGAVVSLPESVAQTLEKQGKAVVLGV